MFWILDWGYLNSNTHARTHTHAFEIRGTLPALFELLPKLKSAPLKNGRSATERVSYDGL